MKSIQHFSPEEQQHLILCSCGTYFDMRNLSQVFKHLHADIPEPDWSYSMKKDEPVAYLRSGEKLDLN
jgi:hypothetical protein